MLRSDWLQPPGGHVLLPIKAAATPLRKQNGSAPARRDSAAAVSSGVLGFNSSTHGPAGLWRHAAPGRPAVPAQQPAAPPARRGLLLLSDAPAGRLLQLRHR